MDIWTEKYRPSTFEEIRGQEKIISRVKAMVKQKNIGNFLFAGPAGVGKSTLAIVIGKELYGPNWRSSFLELNASVTGDTPILIKEKGKIKRTNFKELSEKYFDKKNVNRIKTRGLKVFSLKKDNTIDFLNVNYLFRHEVEEIVNIKYEGGGIKTSLSHSLMVFDEKGNVVSKKAEELKKGDLLITFKNEQEGNKKVLDLIEYKPILNNELRSGLIKNPKIKIDFDFLPLNEDISWAMGLYTAEGCTSLRKGYTSGQTIFTLGFPKEVDMGNKVCSIFGDYNITNNQVLGRSGFDRSKKSSMQYRLLNTQLAKFFRDNFYHNQSEKLDSKNKRIPDFLFEAPLEIKKSFLRGYFDGDGSGKWDYVARISSRSKECLIDVVWLSRLSGLECSYFDGEARIIWKNPKFSYIKSELLPANLFENIARKLNKTYELRHSLYHKKSSRLSKDIAKKLLEEYDEKDELKEKLMKLVESDLSVVKITNIKKEKYNDYVYDVSVPESQTFWGGSLPILLHNSDERGIDVVRGIIKDFARTKALSESFKIIFLDECDSLTKEAQQALRRTMENFTQNTRFILSCNYSSKIIDPIMSRCIVFRFKPLEKEDLKKIIENIAKKENLDLEKGVIEILHEISGGDVRRVENILQSCAALSKKITKELVYDLVGIAQPKEIKEILELVTMKKDFVKARDRLLDTMLKHGLNGMDVIKQVQREIWNLDIDDRIKIKMVDKCGEIEFRMVEGSDEFIQLEALLAGFMNI